MVSEKSSQLDSKQPAFEHASELSVLPTQYISTAGTATEQRKFCQSAFIKGTRANGSSEKAMDRGSRMILRVNAKTLSYIMSFDTIIWLGS